MPLRNNYVLYVEFKDKKALEHYYNHPYDEEFLKVQEELSDYEDLQELRQAKKIEKNAPAVSLEQAKKE